MGAVMVCPFCKGEGHVNYTYNEFKGRKIIDGVKRVFADSFGYVHSSETTHFTNIGDIHFEDGGCTYEEWLNGAEPRPVKDLYCPYIWSSGRLDDKLLLRCREGGRSSVMFKASEDCPFFNDKIKCWEQYEENNKNK